MRRHRDSSESPCTLLPGKATDLLPPGLQVNPILTASAPTNQKVSLIVSILICPALFFGGTYLIELGQQKKPRILKDEQRTVRLLLRDDLPLEEDLGGGGGGVSKNSDHQAERPMSPRIPAMSPIDLHRENLQEALDFRVPVETPKDLPELQPGAQIPLLVGGGAGGGAGNGPGSGNGTGFGRGRGSTLIHSASGEGLQVADGSVEARDYINPEYPQAARLANISGDVIIEVTIDENGKPIKWKVLDGHPCLVAASLDVLPRWRFIPVRFKGKKVQATFEVSMRFTLI